jgi:hypothetical protein
LLTVSTEAFLLAPALTTSRLSPELQSGKTTQPDPTLARSRLRTRVDTRCARAEPKRSRLFSKAKKGQIGRCNRAGCYMVLQAAKRFNAVTFTNLHFPERITGRAAQYQIWYRRISVRCYTCYGGWKECRLAPQIRVDEVWKRQEAPVCFLFRGGNRIFGHLAI